MASPFDIETNLRVNFEPMEWKVFKFDRVMVTALENKLNEMSQSGWDVFDISCRDDVTVIFRKQIEPETEL